MRKIQLGLSQGAFSRDGDATRERGFSTNPIGGHLRGHFTRQRLLFWAVALSGLLLQGCQITTPAASQPVKVSKTFRSGLPPLFLRGSFNLWAIESRYEFRQMSEFGYVAAVSLQQGQPYEMMFSARDPSQTNGNCGYFHEGDKRLKLNRPVTVNCQTVLANFEFTPDKTGVYEFYLNFANVAKPQVMVKWVY